MQPFIVTQGGFVGTRFLPLTSRRTGSDGSARQAHDRLDQNLAPIARVEDALNATRAAVEEGIVPGGGAALVKVANAFNELLKEHSIKLSDEEKVGVRIVQQALVAPLRQIAANAGLKDISLIVNEIKDINDPNSGYDFNTMKKCDMIESGIIDPLKVTRTALENASSIASLIMTTEAAVTDIPKKDEDHGHGGMGGMGGGMGMM